MSSCHELEPLITAWIDGVATDHDRQLVDAHFGTCPDCRARADAEGSVRELIHRRAAQALHTDVPPDLKERCRALCAAGLAAAGVPRAWRPRSTTPARLWRWGPRSTTPARLPRWGPRSAPLAIAAALVLALAGLLVYGLTAFSTTALAAQLALDHVKCFTLTADPHAPVAPERVEAQLRERYGWTIDLPGDSDRLRLMGGRRCLYGEGTIAHILYRHNGAPLSLFMLPDKVQPSEIVEVMGHAAIFWSQNHRTFVLLGNGPREEMEKIAGYIQKMVK